MSNSIAIVEADAVAVSIARARAALAEAKTLQETKHVLDTAAAAEIYARRQKLGEEAQKLAYGIKVEALRKLGEMLAATERNTGARGARKSAVPPGNHAPTLADLGLTKKESFTAQRLAALPEEDFRQVREGHMSVKRAIAPSRSDNNADKSAVTRSNRTQSTPPAPQMTPAGEDVSGISRADAMADAEQLLADLQREIEELQARIAALTADDDAKAQVEKALRLQQQAERARDDALDSAAQMQSRVNWLEHELRRMAQILGIAGRPIREVFPALEALLRQTGAINMRNAA